MTKKPQYLACPCGSSNIRANVYQDVDAYILPNDVVLTGYNFSTRDIEENEFDCADCGNKLELANENGTYSLTKI